MTVVPREQTQRHFPPETVNRFFQQSILPLAVFLIVVFCLTPILWQLLTSFKVNADISSVPTVYIPNQYTFSHYTELFLRRPLSNYMFNSVLIATFSTVFALGLGAPAAYALARLNLQAERFILAAILIVTLFPPILLFLGLLEIVRYLHLANHYPALIILYTALNLPLTILVMRSFFQELPKDLEDAARVDGYSTGRMLLDIVLPMTIPALVTTGILTFIAAWNEFIFALTFLTRESMKTIPVASAQIAGASAFEVPFGPIAAATVLGTLDRKSVV